MTFVTDAKHCWVSNWSFVFLFFFKKPHTAGQHLPTHEISQIYTAFNASKLCVYVLSVQSWNLKIYLLNQCVSAHTHTFIPSDLPDCFSALWLARHQPCKPACLLTWNTGDKRTRGSTMSLYGKGMLHAYRPHTKHTPAGHTSAALTIATECKTRQKCMTTNMQRTLLHMQVCPWTGEAFLTCFSSQIWCYELLWLLTGVKVSEESLVLAVCTDFYKDTEH